MSERTQTTFSLNELTFEAICQCQLVNFKINTDSSYARKNKTGIKGGGGVQASGWWWEIVKQF